MDDEDIIVHMVAAQQEHPEPLRPDARKAILNETYVLPSICGLPRIIRAFVGVVGANAP